MKKNHGLKIRPFFVPAMAVVVTMVFASAVMAQRPAISQRPPVRALGFQAYDSQSKPVGILISFDEDFRATVAVDVIDVYGHLRRVMMNLQRPNAQTADAFANHPALFATATCEGQPSQEQSRPYVPFPALSESPATTIFRDGKLEVWFPKSGEPIRSLPAALGSRMEQGGACESYDFSYWTPDVVPLELVVTDFFSQFPPPYDVR